MHSTRIRSTQRRVYCCSEIYLLDGFKTFLQAEEGVTPKSVACDGHKRSRPGPRRCQRSSSPGADTTAPVTGSRISLRGSSLLPCCAKSNMLLIGPAIVSN